MKGTADEQVFEVDKTDCFTEFSDNGLFTLNKWATKTRDGLEYVWDPLNTPGLTVP